MPNHPHGFDLPQTINDRNEMGIPFTKAYLREDEVQLVGITLFPSFLVFFVNPGLALLLILFTLIAMISWIQSFRKGKYPSWIWDFRYRLGGVQEQRAWMRCGRGTKRRRVLAGTHQTASIHTFVGSKQRGDGFVVDDPSRVLTPPGGAADEPIIQWRPLMTPRQRMVVKTHPDAWNFLDEDGVDRLEVPKYDKIGKRNFVPLLHGFPAPIWWYPPQSADGWTFKGALHQEESPRIITACRDEREPVVEMI